MVFEPVAAAGRVLVQALHPRSWRKSHLNFITVHYIYLIGMTIIVSIMFYPAGLMPYVDAIFFAAGCATQSGLNTIDVNTLYLYQQIIMMLSACLCTPIFINTAVVFVRLYWFEKRFNKLVREVREQRRSRARTVTRTKSEARAGDELDRLEKGVNGRDIRVLHDASKPSMMNGSTTPAAGAEKEATQQFSLKHHRSTSPSPLDTGHGLSDSCDEVVTSTNPEVEKEQRPATPPSEPLSPLQMRREITFPEHLPTPRSAEARIENTSVSDDDGLDKHIRFLEQQHRNAREGGALRIPGPRDVDRGAVPQEVDSAELQRPLTGGSLAPMESEMGRGARIDGRSEEFNADDHPRRGITIDDAPHPARQALEDDSASGAQTGGVRDRVGRVLSGLTHHRSSSRGPLNLAGARIGVSRTFNSLTTARSREKDEDPMPYLSWQATTGRNSAFLELTPAQREELGGIEYRALKTLAKILILYFVGFHIFGMLALLPWILHTNPWKAYVQSVGQDAGWWAVFTAASLFNDLGLTLTPDSMQSFQTAVWPLLVGSFLIVIGNTGFPCMLRFVIWLASKCVRYGSPAWEELRFLLDHPRRCFTLLFPSRATWWLFWILVLFNGIDLLFFIILDLNDSAVTSLTPGFRVLDGLFQAVSTRTAGFGVVNLAALHPAIQVSYLIMMYISVFPIAISVRRTNVYEEKSLGIWGGEEEEQEGGEQSYVGQHLRRQLSFDLWYVFLGFFIICIVEGNRLQDTTEYSFTMFAVLFEIVSAYGTVGLSLGYPGINASFSAEFKVLSKLIIVSMMIRGRHRGLPYALDRAILLPSDNLHKQDDEAAVLSRRRSSRSLSLGPESRGDGLELDEYGLPRQHTGLHEAATAGPDDVRALRRRSSAYTVASHASGREGGAPRPRRTVQERRRSIGMFIAGGLSAGPTLPRAD